MCHLDKLESASAGRNTIEPIKCAALSYRLPLEGFLSKIQKYEASLGMWGRGNVGKAATDKLCWTFREKDEIQRLQTYLNIHIGTINMVLAREGLERMDLHEKKVEESALQVHKS